MNETRFPLCWPVGVPRGKYRVNNGSWKQDFTRIRQDLVDELYRLGVVDIIVSTNARTTAFGTPRGDESPSDPGVAVYFTRKGKRLCLSCDRWSTVRQNIKAITMSIEAIRGLERWGSSDMVERAFTGFAQLPPPTIPQRPWREVFSVGPNDHLNEDAINTRFRALSRIAHPDAGGSHDAMSELNAARAAAIKELHG